VPDTKGPRIDLARQYLDIAGVLVVALDGEGRVSLINKRGCEILGGEEGDILGKDWFRHFLPPQVGEDVRKVFFKILAGELQPLEYYDNPVLTLGGEVRLVAWHNSVLRDPSGKIVGTLSAGEDVTERRRAEEDLRRQNAFRESIIARAAEGICVCHEVPEYPYVAFTVWNERMVEITGYTMEEINRLGWYQTMYPDPETQRQAMERMDRMRRGEDLVTEEWAITRVDGALRTLRISTSILHYADGGAHVLGLMDDLTERRRAEEALRESEERYRLTFAMTGRMVYDYDVPSGRIRWQGAVQPLTGFTAEEIQAVDIRSWEEMIHPEDRPEAIRLLDLAMREGGVYRVEYRFRRKNGSYFVAEDHGVFLPGADGKAVRMLGSMGDVTDRRWAEDALRESEERYRRLFEQSSDAIVIHTLEGRILNVNRQACEMLGYAGLELLRLPLKALFRDGVLPVPVVEMALGAQESLVHLEGSFVRSDGTPVDVELNVRVIEKETGIVQTVVRDITLRKRLQDEQRRYAERLESEVADRTRQIRESEERHRALFENVDHAIVLTDPEGRVRSWNPAAARLFGLSRPEAEGRFLGQAVGTNLGLEGSEGVRRIALQSGPWSQEGLGHDAAGAEIPIHATASAVRDAEGRPQGLIWLFSDLSEKERLVHEARRAKDYAEAVLRTSGFKGEMVGRSAAYHAMLDFMKTCSGVSSPVLILGESGTGKDVLARAIHLNGPRAGKPFVVVDCATLQGTLLESELFGHEQGAYTGAHEMRAGLVEVAAGGTLFVDEIGEMAPELQPKLLRVLERGEYRRLGSSRESRVDMRVIAATNRDLAGDVKEGRFRADLFFRLKVLTHSLKPLRERREDIPILAQHFLENSRVTISASKRFHGDTLKALESYDWPGNVRELANVVERAVILSGPRELILPIHLPSEVRHPSPVAARQTAVRSMAEIEREEARKALEATGGNKSKAAELLGISRPTLRRRLAEKQPRRKR
jgi:two-component system response regulator HydG